MKKFLASLNVFQQCRELNVSPFSCPRFLFVLMGLVIIGSILITYFVGQYYVTPDMVIALVSGLTIVLMIIMHVVVQAFEQVVLARQKELAHAKEVLLLRDQFVYVAIHHLRSGGTAIKWGLKLLEEESEAHKGGSGEIVRQIRQKNEEFLKLAHDILLVTRIDGETLVVKPEKVSLGEAIAAILKDKQDPIAERKARVLVALPENLPPVFADPAHTREVLGILIENAIAHSDLSAPVVSVTATEKRHEILIAVENNGPAIPADDLEHIFEQYWRSGSPGHSEGAGFPLYIAHALTERMGGRMWFSSTPDSTNFTVALPMA